MWALFVRIFAFPYVLTLNHLTLFSGGRKVVEDPSETQKEQTHYLKQSGTTFHIMADLTRPGMEHVPENEFVLCTVNVSQHVDTFVCFISNSIRMLKVVVINSRTAIAGAIIGLLLVFYNSKNLNCIGALSFFYNPRIGLYWCSVFFTIQKI